jgi:hypothetical protein
MIGVTRFGIIGTAAAPAGGGARDAAATRQEKDLVVKNCLRNRGYRVLS